MPRSGDLTIHICLSGFMVSFKTEEGRKQNIMSPWIRLQSGQPVNAMSKSAIANIVTLFWRCEVESGMHSAFTVIYSVKSTYCC